MPCVIPFDNGATISLTMFKPHGSTMDDLVECLIHYSNWFESTGCAQVFILKSIHGNTGIVCLVWATGPGADTASSTLPSVETIHKAISPRAEIVKFGWFDVHCGECKNGIPAAKICRGDVVSIRGLLTESEEQQNRLSYATLALLKSFFQRTKGLQSSVVIKSLDGQGVGGINVWEGLQHAYAWIFDPYIDEVLKPFLAGLFIRSMYDVLKVVYATGDDVLPNYIGLRLHGMQSLPV